MRITSHASCAPIVEINPDGTVRVSRMEYTREGRSSIRHIMETCKNGQSVVETLKEGVFKEGAKDRRNFQLDILSEEPIHMEFVPDESHAGGDQLKVVFPVFVRPDQLRGFSVQDDDNPSELHGPITLVEVTRLLKLEGHKFIPFHYRATLAVVAWAARKEAGVFHQYARLVENWKSRVPSLEQFCAIEEYHGKW